MLDMLTLVPHYTCIYSCLLLRRLLFLDHSIFSLSFVKWPTYLKQFGVVAARLVDIDDLHLCQVDCLVGGFQDLLKLFGGLAVLQKA